MHSLRSRIATLALVLVLIAPSLFIVAEANHDCTGDGCEICQTLCAAVSLTHASADIPAPNAPVLPVLMLMMTCVAWCVHIAAQTLVGLKVRLDC